MPALAVVDAHAVAAVFSLQGGAADKADIQVAHSVAYADHPAIGGGAHLDSLVQSPGVSQGDVGALVPIVAHSPTGEVGVSLPGV